MSLDVNSIGCLAKGFPRASGDEPEKPRTKE